MAAAGAILVRTLKLLEGKIRAGVTTGELDEAAEKFIRSQGADARLQGLPRLPGLDLRVAQLDGRARHPGPLQARARRHHLVDVGVVKDGWVADAARTFPVGPITPLAAASCSTRREASLFDAVEQCRPGNRLGDVSHAVQARVEARGPVGRPLARRPRHRPRHARGPADPQLRRPGRGPAARGGHGARRRADGHRRAATRCGWATTAGRSTPRTARWPRTSSSRSRSRPSPVLTPWHDDARCA